jgi:dipeptidyl aminopeptidase/acylaminoacyl peptidase
VSEAAEAAAVLSARLLVDQPRAGEPVISPDGRWVAWTTTTLAGAGERQDSDLWLAPAGGGSVPLRLTDGGERARLPRWSPDSAWLCYAVDGEVRRLGVDAAGKTGTRAIVLRWGGEISALAPLAGGRLAVVAGDEQSEADEHRQAAGDDAMAWSERAVRQHWTWHRLRLLDLDSGTLTVVGGLAGRHVTALAQRPGGGPLAVISQDCPEYDPGAFTSRLGVVSLDDGTVTDLGQPGLDARCPAWWRGDDGWHVAWLAAVPPGDIAAVFDVAVPSGPAEGDGHRDLTAGMSVCPEELVQVAGGTPAALFAAGLDTALYRLDPDGRSFRRVARWTGRAFALSVSEEASVVAVLAGPPDSPPDVCAGPARGLTRISDTGRDLRAVSWGIQERLSWRAADGLQLDGLLVLPPGLTRADGPFPLVTMVHGGPYYRWADEFITEARWLAAAGTVVFCPNPRGGQGHGREFAATVLGRVGQEEWTDILAGLDQLIADGVADPARLGITGWSHGGFMAAWAVTQTGRFRAAMMGAGVADWSMEVGVGDFGRAEASLSGSYGWEGPGPHRHDQLSPVSYAARVTTPVLILHGADDTNVPVGQAVYFHRALTQFGVPHELVIYPREGHSLTERAHQADALERIRSWFTRWLTIPSGS